jgi:tricorn protease
MIKKLNFVFVALLISAAVLAQQESRMLRFPAIYGNQVVFSFAGDLYTVSSDGGTARKLTSHKGYEMFPHFSPDGKTIAFTAQYDGNTEVYIIPSTGGEPKRLTYTATLERDDIADRMGPNNIVTSWAPDGKHVIYRSRKASWNDFVGQLYSVSIDGGLSEQLPLSSGGFNSYSPDGKKLAFNRVMREFRTWKYYKGGMADDIRIFDTETKNIENITNNPAQDIFPMWWKNEIYFLSDRDRTMNLFAYNLDTKQTRKVTQFDVYDIKFPTLGDGKIIFENGGFIYTFDIASQKSQKLTININDDDIYARQRWVDATKYINSYQLAPNGSRFVFTARGDVWVVPVKPGIAYNLTQTSGTHERESCFSPNGKYIAYLSDATGEFEVYMKETFSNKPAIQLTQGSDVYIFAILWSPDSKKIAFNDKKFNLKFVDIDTRQVTLVNQSKTWEITDFSWSPDSKLIAYSDRTLQNTMNQLFVYNLLNKTTSSITSPWYSSAEPTFSKDGKYMFFVSDRDFNPTYSETEWNHSYSNMSKIYFVTLQKETENPLAPTNKPINLNDTTSKNKPVKGIPQVKIDFDNIYNRMVALPISAGNYWNINSVDNDIYYAYNLQGSEKTELKYFNLTEQKETGLGEYNDYQISSDLKHIAIKKDNNYYVIDLPKQEIKLTEPVSIKDMKTFVDVKAEWMQIYTEAWRQMRDFFYDPNMHGLDWKKMYEKYKPLAEACRNRNDLTYVIGELIGELSIGHSYVGGGDQNNPERIKLGLLGAKISKHSSGYYRIDKILQGENWEPTLRSPLTEVGVNVNEGDYIIAINNNNVKSVNDIYELLTNKANTPVELSISSQPNETSVRKVIVTPIADENPLYYFNWVQGNIKKVSEATNGEVGYVHIPDMGVEGLNEFVKYFYPQLAKKALIVDDRGNGGGNVSPMITERLKRQIAFMGMARNQIEGEPTPNQMILGPKVLLINQYSASDGDLFPFQFKKYNIGKVIGVRSWGGVVGIRGSLPFMDGGFLMKPEFGHYAADGKSWIIEGHGVDPDIEVDNDPYKEYLEEDTQLTKAIEVILDEMKKNPVEKGPIPPFPDKSK